MAKRVLILGVGNTLLGDEGFGVHALRFLEENYTWPPHVRLVDGGTLGLLLLAELLECDQAFFLDIALGGRPPGTFYRIDEDALTGALSVRQSAHQTSLTDTLISCELAGRRPEATIFAMEPYHPGEGEAALSPEAMRKLPGFCESVVRELIKAGIEAQPRVRES